MLIDEFLYLKELVLTSHLGVPWIPKNKIRKFVQVLFIVFGSLVCVTDIKIDI